MFYTYILQSEVDNRYYIGQTNNVFKRFERHNRGNEKYTKKYIPWKLVFHKNFETRAEAMSLERKLKSFKNSAYLKQWITENS